MKVEDPIALRFILQDELYLLNEDKDLYNSLTQSLPQPQREIETPAVSFNYLGANKKNFLILVNYAADEFMQDAHLTALESVLTRKDHGRDDVAIVNMAKHASTNYLQLKDYFTPITLVILGEKAIPAGMDSPQFNKPGKLDNLTVLYTFGFDEMMTNNDHKKAFWEQMKTL